MKEWKLVCTQCGEEHTEQLAYECKKCRGILKVESKEQNEFSSDNNFWGLWRYHKMLPIKNLENIISLGEGMTSLVKTKNICLDWGIENLYVKNEFSNPTGSFKDRPTSVGISAAKEQGIKTVAVASTGNAGVATAAYAAKAGMECLVCAPEQTSSGKIAQLLSYGAHIYFVNGGYSQCFNLVKEACQNFGYANLTSTYVNPYTVEGDKTVAYEIFEQLKGNVPDWIVVPIGTGPLLSGIWRGFLELKRWGLTDKLPRMVGVQAERCSPIVKGFFSRSPVEAQQDLEDTLAGGIADQLEGYEKDGDYTNQQIRESKGTCVMLSEDEIFVIWHKLCLKEGIFSEPTGAVSMGAVNKLLERRVIKKDEVVVALVTGHGLKSPDVAKRLNAETKFVTNADELIL